MITLRVEDYCHDCPDFEADVNKEEVSTAMWDDVMKKWDFPVINCTTIYCKHRYKCHALKEHLEKKASKENKKDETKL